MKNFDFMHVLFCVFMAICAPILIFTFGVYGVIKMICSNEDDERLCD